MAAAVRLIDKDGSLVAILAHAWGTANVAPEDVTDGGGEKEETDAGEDESNSVFIVILIKMGIDSVSESCNLGPCFFWDFEDLSVGTLD